MSAPLWAALAGSIAAVLVILWCLAEAAMQVNRENVRTRKAPRHCRCSKHNKEVQ